MSERLLSDEALEHEYGAHTHLDSLRAIAAAQHAHTIAKLAAAGGVDAERAARDFMVTRGWCGGASDPDYAVMSLTDLLRDCIARALASRDAELERSERDRQRAHECLDTETRHSQALLARAREDAARVAELEQKLAARAACLAESGREIGTLRLLATERIGTSAVVLEIAEWLASLDDEPGRWDTFSAACELLRIAGGTDGK